MNSTTENAPVAHTGADLPGAARDTVEARPGTPLETIEHGFGPPPPDEGRGLVGQSDTVLRS
ncbi:hypothetical protein FYJ43_08495 [Cutibacterium sp. WCA-380-WT-3A]|uniref:Uncharacterized protein n=1 Tax=Cutibacterium porci TaxID=2605781 RepID=A0A7K0J7Y3_9ACTN|nr:hypothetical protein [Cutibacterium porci]